MNGEQEIPGERQQDVLCAPIRLQNDALGEQGRKLLRSWKPHCRGEKDFGPGNCPPDHSLSQVAHNRFDFWDFRHNPYNETVVLASCSPKGNIRLHPVQTHFSSRYTTIGYSFQQKQVLRS
jgi:hypothetical protein